MAVSVRFEEDKSHNLNQISLLIAASFYGVFGIAEAYYGTAAHSLALAADSANCIVDAITYIVSYFVEDYKISNDDLTYFDLLIVEIYIPVVSIFVLMGFMIYIMVDAIVVLNSPPDSIEVDMDEVLIFSFVNIAVNVCCIGILVYNSSVEKSKINEKIIMGGAAAQEGEELTEKLERISQQRSM